nr:MAG TPA: hypothetical protein [Caudoviricetes sp.]
MTLKKTGTEILGNSIEKGASAPFSFVTLAI